MRKKLKKFSMNENDPRIVQPGKDFYENAKWQWNSSFFHNDNKLVLELACGKGEYSVGLAPHYPKKNFVGVDIKGERMRVGSQKANENNYSNVWFLRTLVHHIDNFFEQDEVDEIWVIHPDPRPKNRDAKKRLTHPRFLHMYEKILKPGGILRLKTDDTCLFHYSVETLVAEWRTIEAITFDLYESPLYQEHHNIVTHYEKIFREQGRNIKYVRARKTINKK